MSSCVKNYGMLRASGPRVTTMPRVFPPRDWDRTGPRTYALVTYDGGRRLTATAWARASDFDAVAKLSSADGTSVTLVLSKTVFIIHVKGKVRRTYRLPLAVGYYQKFKPGRLLTIILSAREVKLEILRFLEQNDSPLQVAISVDHAARPLLRGVADLGRWAVNQEA